MKYIFYISVLSIVLSSTNVSALPRSGSIDKNGDGVITWEEFQEAFPGVTREHFTEIDTDKNELLDEKEMSVFRNRFGGARPNGARGGMSGSTMPPQQPHTEGDGHNHGGGLPVLPSKQ
ncbi:MAG: hypothetical protein K2M30_03935 [Desulfovibrionaceae bacterium]|nr:hypothetical protein [Desulfovibrionaceae bacterium]